MNDLLLDLLNIVIICLKTLLIIISKQIIDFLAKINIDINKFPINFTLLTTEEIFQ